MSCLHVHVHVRAFFGFSSLCDIWRSLQANVIGRNENVVREFLERSYKEGLNEDETIRLAIKALLQVSKRKERREAAVRTQ